MDVLYNFALHDQLPIRFTMVSRIMSFAPGVSPLEEIERNLRREVVFSFSVQPLELWQKGFATQNITTINFVKKKVRK